MMNLIEATNYFLEDEEFSLPNENSLGNPIAQTEEALKNFWNWFGDSKVVDKQGRPIVVYHGTDKHFSEFDTKGNTRGIYVSKSSKIASAEGGYIDPDLYIGIVSSDEIDKSNAKSNTTVYALYASIKNPARRSDVEVALDAVRESHAGATATINYLKSRGFDGVMTNEYEYIAFNPNQIKSAIGNKGTYKKTDDRLTEATNYFLGEDSHGIYYHGSSRHGLKVIRPSSETNNLSEKGRKKNLNKVFVTQDIGLAWIYAGRAVRSVGGTPVVYEVIPVGDVEVVSDVKGATVFSADTANVIKEIKKDIPSDIVIIPQEEWSEGKDDPTEYSYITPNTESTNKRHNNEAQESYRSN